MCEKRRCIKEGKQCRVGRECVCEGGEEGGEEGVTTYTDYDGA